MIKQESALCGLQPRHLSYAFMIVTITVILAVNLHPIQKPCPRCQQSKISLEPPPQPTQKSTKLDALPQQEQNLVEKVLETKYTSIWMGAPEVNLVLRYIHGKDNYLEWGSGGSTLNFPRWCTKAVSIEHDASWCSKMKDKIVKDDALHHIDYRCVPVKRGFAGWGASSPFDEGSYKAFNKYIDEIENTGIDTFDFVLVDGRARVDCTIKVLSYIKNDSIVVLHDASRIWGTGRYRDVEKYYSFISYVGGDGKQGVVVMRRKKEFAKLQGDHQAVQRILNEKYPDLVRNVTEKDTGQNYTESVGQGGTDREDTNQPEAPNAKANDTEADK